MLSVILLGQSQLAQWLTAFGVVAEAAPEPHVVHGRVSLDT